MKKILTLALTLCGVASLITVAVRAAGTPAPATATPPAQTPAPTANSHPGEKFAAMIAEKLGLTPEQKSKIDSLRQDQRTALDAVAADKSLSDDARREKVREVIKSHLEQMKAVLTPEQQQKVARARQHFMGGQGRGHGRPQGFGQGDPDMGRGPGGLRQFGGPGHNPEQMRVMAERSHRMMERMHERRAEMLGLTDEQQAKLRLIAFQHHEKAIALRKEMKAAMEAVLTPEQKAKVKEMKEHSGQRPHGPGHRPGDDDDDDDDDDDGKKGPPSDH